MRGFRPFSYIWLLGLLAVIPLQDSHPAGAQSEYDHAEQLSLRGHLEESQRDAEQGFKRFQISDPAWAEKFLVLEADSMVRRGSFDSALRLLADDHFHDNDQEEVVKRLTIESLALLRQQGLSKAGEKLREAEALCKSHQYLACGEVLRVRGIFAAREAKFDEARQCFLDMRSLALDRHDRFLETSAALDLGWEALQVGHFDEAIDWSRSAHQSAVDLGAEDLAETSSGNLGWAYFQLGDDERALDQFLAAEKAAARLGNIRNELKWLSDAGYVYRDAGDLARAAQSYRQALDLGRQIDSKDDIVGVLQDLAYISVVTGNLDEASKYIRQVISMETDNGFHPAASLAYTMGRLAEERHEFSEAEADFHSIQNDPGSLITYKLNAGFELAQIAEAQGEFTVAEGRYKTTLRSYEAARSRLKGEESRLPFGTNAAQIYDRYIHFLVKQGKTDAALAVADQSRAQTLEQRLGGPGARKQVISATLNPRQVAQKTGSTLLFYWLGEKQSYLWAITPSKTKFFTLPAGREIANHIEHYRTTLIDVRDPLETGDADGQTLYQELVAPAAALIRHGTPVIVLADGILSQLNFETLLVPGAATGSPSNGRSNGAMHYLLDDMTLSSAPSLAMLAAAEPINGAKGKILLLGNPVAPNQDYPSLPMFGFEMTRIESHFAPGRVAAFAGQQATPAAYLASDPVNYSYIHFVSHAVASQTNPLDSAIILSEPPGQENSYKLYAREIIQHPIDAKLVTISACYGTGTRAYAGEGLVGLSWAFLRAGAQRVIGALWEVSDESTPRLMDSLYQGLTQGEAPAAALRNAKLQLLHSQGRFRLPFYWAPFQIYTRR